MSRYNTALDKHGCAIVKGLLADESFGAVFEELGDIKFDTRFKKRLKNDNLNTTDKEEFIAPIFAKFAELTDPTANKPSSWKYLDWICRAYLNSQKSENRLKAEDLYKIKNDLIDFGSFQDRLPVTLREINNFESYQAMLDSIRLCQQKRDARKAQEEKISEKVKTETSVLYEGPEGRVVMPHTKESAIFWGQQTRWCLSASDSYNYFHHYNDKAPIYFYMTNPDDEERRMLTELSSFKFCATGGTLYNERDIRISYMPLSLKKLFDAAAQNLGDNPERKREFYKAARFEDLRILAKRDDHVLNRKEDLLRLINEDPAYYRLAQPDLKADKDCAMAALNRSKMYYKDIPQSLYEDKEIARKIYNAYAYYNKPSLADPVVKFAEKNWWKIGLGGVLTGAFTFAAFGIITKEDGTSASIVANAVGGGLLSAFALTVTTLAGGMALIGIESSKDATAGKFKSHKKIKEELIENIPQPNL